ncbi:hypothetical protein C5167_009007 [Papaver somniferum]|uniref:Endonuclease/exonuclease/phosphatase domain-containing protein n=1 Tax=Papaver somniferum TaxID=3469 RepID=A0A4Y7JW45_PAPSO|nr:hypothetical protein C5167_009007 [Papaver somniferum]
MKSFLEMESSTATLKHRSKQEMDSMSETFITFMYGNPKKHERIKDWICIEDLADQIDAPWLINGDLNVTLSAAKKYGGAPFQQDSITNITSIIDSCGLVDLGFIGPVFTWSNKQDSHVRIQARLD